MRPTIAAVALLTLVVIATATAQPQSPSKLAIAFGQHDATITGLKPGGQAILLGAGVEAKGAYSLLFRWSGTLDDTDHDGTISIDFARSVPRSTIWCVVDAVTGDYVVASPGGRPVSVMPLHPNALKRHGTQVSQFSFDHPSLDLHYFEPGRGGWTYTGADGGRNDDDGPNGMTTVSVGRFKALSAGSDTPGEFHPGGLLVAVDAIRLEVAVGRLDAAMIGAAR